MFFESPRRYKCKDVEPSQYNQGHQAVTDYMSLCSKDYCHGERTSSPITTNSLVVTPPKPAPRKIRGNLTGVQQSSHLFSPISKPSPSIKHETKLSNDVRKLPNNLMNNQNIIIKTIAGLNNNNNNNNNNTKVGATNHTQPLAHEESNESSSEDDTEDSADNKLQDRPKPGKLDLRQFDNITNAIGKLSVQSSIKPLELNAGAHSKTVSSSPATRNENPQDAGFFKNRSKKTKSRTVKDSQQQGGSKEKLASFGTRDRQLREVRGISNSNQEIESNQESHRPIGFKLNDSAIQRKSSDHREDDQLTSIKTPREKSSRPKNEARSSKIASVASTFVRTNSQDNSDSSPIDATPAVAEVDSEKILPRPAPRSTQNSSKTTFTPPVTSSFVSTNSAPKRINNPRQNHGRAVAPPQLPGGITTLASRLDNESLASDPVTASHDVSSSSSSFAPPPLHGDDCTVDFSQSPITQRLLKHSKDYKVSELNSPYESDCEPSQTINQLRGQQLYRGQSFGLENNSPSSVFINSSIDSSGLMNSRGAAIRQLNEILANKQPPGRPGGPKLSASRSSSLDQEQQQLQQHQQQQQLPIQASKKNDKDAKKDKKKLRDDEKLEKRRLKEEERIRRQEKKLAAKKSKSSSAGQDGSVGEDGIPFFIKRCIEFIEFEGLDAEGIYRVPGNRAHVDAFVQKFKENPDMSIVESDIPVNAVATALKDFLSKKWGPIIPLALMNELTELSNISEKEQRVQAVRQLVQKLPSTNYKLLKYVFSHFVRVSLNHSLNSMDSKNLAICWWPTLLPLHFSDMVMFEQMRPHLEESIQTMIDQYDFIFDSEEPTSTAT